MLYPFSIWQLKPPRVYCSPPLPCQAPLLPPTPHLLHDLLLHGLQPLHLQPDVVNDGLQGGAVRGLSLTVKVIQVHVVGDGHLQAHGMCGVSGFTSGCSRGGASVGVGADSTLMQDAVGIHVQFSTGCVGWSGFV